MESWFKHILFQKEKKDWAWQNMRHKPSPIHTTDMQDSTYITRNKYSVVAYNHTARYNNINCNKDMLAAKEIIFNIKKKTQ